MGEEKKKKNVAVLPTREERKGAAQKPRRHTEP